MCINEILPKPYHNKFSKVPIKHATHCLATATHYLLRKHMFDSKVSQSTLARVCSGGEEVISCHQWQEI